MNKVKRYDSIYIKIPEYNYDHFIKCLSKINYCAYLRHGFVNYFDEDNDGLVGYEVIMDGYYIREDLYKQ